MNKSLQIVTFEQAMKLKELGFPFEECVVRVTYNLDTGYIFTKPWEENFENYEIIAPTTALAIKWLRTKEILIYIKAIEWHMKNITVRYFFEIHPINIGIDNHIGGTVCMKNDKIIYFETYEEAESAGLDYALEYLNPKNNE